MAAYNFPDTTGQLTDGSFTYTAPTGEIYSWNGYSWVTAASTEAGTYVKKAGDSMSGDLEINAKASSLATQANDPDNTLATKSYVDTNISTAGVFSIIAGDGISVNQATGNVTITNTGGGGSGGDDSGGGGTTKADIYGTAKAWGYFEGVSSNATAVPVNGSSNVASITRNGKGLYDVVFTTPMANDNYSVSVSSSSASVSVKAAITAAGFTIDFRTTNNEANDPSFGWFQVFDDEPAEIIVGSGTVANTNLYGTAKAQASVLAGGTLQSGSRNIASVVKNAVGDYTVNFITPFSDTTYEVVVSQAAYHTFLNERELSSVRVRLYNQGNTNVDVDFNIVAFDNTPAEVALTTFGDVINYSGAAAWGDVAADGTLNGGLNATVTNTGTGAYRVDFLTPMPNADYSVTAAVGGASWATMSVGGSKDATGFSIFRLRNADGQNESNAFTFAVHALNALPPKGGTGTDSWGSCESDGTIKASFNVASVTKTNTGIFDVVFTTPMPTDKYSVTISSTGGVRTAGATDKTVNGFTAKTYNTSPTNDFNDNPFDFTVNATNAKLPNSFSEEEIQSVVDLAQSGATNPGASAWAVFNGNTGVTDTINQSLNVASCTRTAAGKYDVVFTTPMPSTAYSVQVTSTQLHNVVPTSSVTASGFSIETRTGDASNNLADSSRVSFTVFATNALPLKGGTGTDSWASVDETTVNGPCNVPASFNVASVTRTAKGNYDVVFTTPMPTNSYSVVGNTLYDSSSTTRQIDIASTSTTGYSLRIWSYNGSAWVAQDTAFSAVVNATNATLPSTITQEEADLIIDTIKGGGVAQKVAILADVKPNATNAGDNVVGWQDRTLNTIVSDTGNLVTLANDKEFTLKAGSYLIEWSAPGYNCNAFKTKLTNVTTGSTEGLGSSEYSGNPGGLVASQSIGSTRINITANTTYKIEQYAAKAGGGNGLGAGVTSSTGEDNTFTQVTITDLAVLAAGGDGGGGTTTPGVRYQQGSWTANWMRGDQNNNGQLDTSNGMTFTRVGQLVTISVRRSGALNVDGAGSMTNLPYPIEGERASGVTADQTVFYNNAPDYISFRSPFAGRYARFTTTYVTDDTSFIPGNNATVTEDIQGTGGGGGGTTEIYGTAKAWGQVDSSGNSLGGYGFTSTKIGTGEYQITFDKPAKNNEYACVATSFSTDLSESFASRTTLGFVIQIDRDGTKRDGGFALAVHDNEPITVSGGGGDIVYNGASAWGFFNSSDGSLKSGMNVNPATRTATGRYTVTYINPMSSADYAAVVSPASSSGRISATLNQTASQIEVWLRDQDGSSVDSSFSLIVHSANAIAPQSGVGADSWGSCKADGTLDASFNVASVTKTGAGRYDVVLLTPMPTVDYAIVVNGQNCIAYADGKTTTGFRVLTQNSGGTAGNDQNFTFTVHASSTVTPTYTWKRDGTTLKPANDGDDVEAGAATFAGSIETTSGSANESIGFYPNGGSVFNRSVTDNSASFINCFAVGVSKIRLACDGKVTASNVSFNLEPDNVANFSANGEYTGPTLDVKALLLTLQTAAARIATLEAKVQTLETDHTTLMNNDNGGGY